MSTVEVSAPEAAPPSPGRWRALLLAAVAACAACGIIYELALLTLSASLDGGGIVATSLIVAGYIAALGVGALLAKPLLAHAALGFIAVEALLGVVGGLSAAALYVVFAFLDGSVGSTWVLAVSTALIGGLVGAEVPLLMTLLQRGRTAGPADAGRTLANLNAADYLGALLGGLVWPFLLLPQLGMIRGAAATGMINLAAAAVVAIFLLRQVVSARQLALALCALAAALALLATLLLRSADVETTSRQRLYADPIIAYRHTPYQEIVVTRRGDDTRLYLDGGLQFSTRDEYRYTESLVYPALGNGARSVLVLGGGDGLAARELLRQPGISRIVQVELDPAVIEIARTTLRAANGGSLDNPRVRVLTGDAMAWLRGPNPDRFDAVIVDLPDPDTPGAGAAVLHRVLHAGRPRAGARRAAGGAGGQPVLHPDGVLAHGVDHPGGRLRRHALPRARAHVRRLGLRAGPARRHPARAQGAARRAATALPRSAGAAGRGGVLRRRRAAPAGTLDAGQSAHRRRHAARLRLIGLRHSSIWARISSGMSALVHTSWTSSLSSSASTSRITFCAPSASSGTVTDGWNPASAES